MISRLLIIYTGEYYMVIEKLVFLNVVFAYNYESIMQQQLHVNISEHNQQAVNDVNISTVQSQMLHVLTSVMNENPDQAKINRAENSKSSRGAKIGTSGVSEQRANTNQAEAFFISRSCSLTSS